MDSHEVLMSLASFCQSIQVQAGEQQEWAYLEGLKEENETRRVNLLCQFAKGVGKIEAANAMIVHITSLLEENENGG